MVTRLLKKVGERLRRAGRRRQPNARAQSKETPTTSTTAATRKTPARATLPEQIWRPGEGRSDENRAGTNRPAGDRADQSRSPTDKPTGDRSSQSRSGADTTAGEDTRPKKRRRRRRRRPKPREQAPADSAPQAAPHDDGWSVQQFVVARKEGETRFHDLELPDPLMHAIADLDFKYCTPIQAAALPPCLAAKNVAGRAQTGTGKTAAFLICAFTHMLRNPLRDKRLNGRPRALVIAPTRELVIQITRDAEAIGKYGAFRTLAVYGGMDYAKQEQDLRARPLDLLVATPGRLLDFERRRVVSLRHVEVLVIDEADRMLDMGFIPDVRRIVHAMPSRTQRQTLLFSATLTPEVMKLAAQWMPDPVVIEIEPEKVAVETVQQIVYIVTVREKLRLLCNILRQDAVGRVLIFTNRRERARRLAASLGERGFECAALSGAVDQKKRLRILDAFHQGTLKVIAATDVAARGLHVEDITHVINFDFPTQAVDYVHRIGRTGRIGTTGTAISFACEEESFVIPEIEELLGEPLRCTYPDPELLVRDPHPRPHRRRSRPRHRPPRRD